MRRAITTLLLPLAAVGVVWACGGAPSLPATPKPVLAAASLPTKVPAWTYWEPVEVPVVEGVASAELPVDVTHLALTPASDRRWAAAPLALRDAVTRRGFAVTEATPPRTRLGDFYASLRDDRVPWVITLDALFFLAHVAIDRANADVDAGVVAPALGAMLRRLEVRLGAESRGAGADLAPAYLVARGVVAVAIALAQPDYHPSEDLAPLVEGEKSRVLAHSAIGVSPWLGVPLDYSAMSPRGQADHDEAHASWFRAVAWLQHAALALEGRGEGAVRAQVDVATARTHARAALLLSRLLEHDVDAEAASSWARVERVGDLLLGDPDDATPRDLEAAAAVSRLDIRNGDWFSNVIAVDRVRHAGARARVARVDDGAEGAQAPARHEEAPERAGRLSPGFRLIDPRVTPDAELLQSLVFPSVGPPSRAESPPTERDGVRALPSSLDVAAWLGSIEARAALRDSGDDAYGRFDETLTRLRGAFLRAESVERHRTPYLSSLDTLEAWLGPSIGDRIQPGAMTAAWRARKAAVALAAWTELRHDALPMARVQVAGVRLPPREPAETTIPIFVEPHPEAIAGLLALVRQTSRALIAEGMIAPDASAATVLEEVQELLWAALGVAVHEAADQPVPSVLLASMAAFPARLRALEAALGETGGAAVPLAADVHTDVASGRALEELLGFVQESWMVMREPGSHREWLALGASVPHLESIAPMSQRLSDGVWAARLLQDGQPPPAPLERAYFVSSR